MVAHVRGSEKKSKVAKTKKSVAAPKRVDLLSLAKQDPELKAFLRLIQENGFREKALTLLSERIATIH